MALEIVQDPGARECRLVVQGWQEAGLIHGFLGAALSAAVLGTAVPTVFGRRVLLLRQVHSRRVVRVSSVEPGLEGLPQGDAWVGSGAGNWIGSACLGIKSADCFPVLIYDRVNKAVAAVHAGWKGAVKGALEEAILALRDLGSEAQNLEIAIGPGARVCCYQVGEEVKEEFLRASGCFGESSSAVVEVRGGRWYASIERLLELQAEVLGVIPDRVVSSRRCTICTADFCSYRRDGDRAGRNVSFIGGRAIC